MKFTITYFATKGETHLPPPFLFDYKSIRYGFVFDNKLSKTNQFTYFFISFVSFFEMRAFLCKK